MARGGALCVSNRRRKHNKRPLLGDDTEVENVQRMFTMYVEGETAVSVSRILNDEGHPSPFGKLWAPNTIYEILKRPVYVGDHRFNSSLAVNITGYRTASQSNALAIGSTVTTKTLAA